MTGCNKCPKCLECLCISDVHVCSNDRITSHHIEGSQPQTWGLYFNKRLEGVKDLLEDLNLPSIWTPAELDAVDGLVMDLWTATERVRQCL